MQRVPLLKNKCISMLHCLFLEWVYGWPMGAGTGTAELSGIDVKVRRCWGFFFNSNGRGLCSASRKSQGVPNGEETDLGYNSL